MASLRSIFLFSVRLFFVTAVSSPIAAQRQTETEIVFVHAPDGGAPWPVEDIYIMDAESRNVKSLTNDGHSHNPAWSPDGKRLLFVHDSELHSEKPSREEKQFESHHPVELYVMDRDGGNRHLLRRMEPVIYSAAWSPDGKTLAVSAVIEAAANRRQSPDEPVHAGLFLLPADAQGEPRLLFQDALTPAWSPDGTKLAFSLERPRGQWAVHVANSDGSDDVRLTEPPLLAGSPAWSPDGKLLAYDQFIGSRDQGIFVMEADGSHKRQIATGSNRSCDHPSWSSDGKQLVFSCHSVSVPCGMGVSSVGTRLPESERRIFGISPFEPKAKPIQLSDRDGAGPEFGPAR